MKSYAETGRLREILSCTHKSLDCIQRLDGCWTTSSLKTLELLLDTHFPGSVTLGDQAFYQVNEPSSGNYSLLTLILGQVQWYVRSFKPFKFPGPDDVIPGDIQQGKEIILPWLLYD